MRFFRKSLFIGVLVLGGLPNAFADKNQNVENSALNAARSAPGSLAGIWIPNGDSRHMGGTVQCVLGFGIAIAPADPNLYSISFCGPGGCFLPGEWTPNSSIAGDPKYKIVNDRTIKIRRAGKWDTYTKCNKSIVK
jgi:hypothetical protein